MVHNVVAYTCIQNHVGLRCEMYYHLLFVLYKVLELEDADSRPMCVGCIIYW